MADGAEFFLWAPSAHSVELFRKKDGTFHPMEKNPDGVWGLRIEGFAAGELYGFRPDGQGPFPDPASRFQSLGVHGLSQAVDLSAYPWKHSNPRLPIQARRSIYELHVGAFTPEGTFKAARSRLPYLRDLGITLIELMPVADFPGERNWGYDGVSLFAPARCYGSPEDLCALVDEAHALGMGVLLDVVYNHFGPDGNYTGVYSPQYLHPGRHTPWGSALNFDQAGSRAVRGFFISNAEQWIRDYRFDGLRLDATHAILDEGVPHFLAEAVAAARAAAPGREILLYAEDHGNDASFVAASESGGHGFDGIWADDLHHHLRRRVAGDNEGYFADFDGGMERIARTLERGWHRDGSEASGPLAQGTDPDPLDYGRFVVCIQNHDQIGNRAFGDRIHHQVSDGVYRALSALLILAPHTPLLFMGQEWAASAPFQFFTDHNAELGRFVTEGRRREFAAFSAFLDPSNRERIPDPQALTTFQASRLDWDEHAQARSASVLAFYRSLLALRNTHRALDSDRKGSLRVFPHGEDGLVFIRIGSGGALACVICLAESGGSFPVPGLPEGGREWTRILSSEEGVPDGGRCPIESDRQPSGEIRIHFTRPGAWIGET